jgi:hypothetical protein
MKAEAVIYALLTGAGAVTSVVQDRIYPVVLPEGVATPAIVFELLSSVHVPALDAQASTHHLQARVQVNLLGPSYAQIRDLRTAVINAVRYQRGSIAGAQVHAVLPGFEGPVTFDSALGLFHRPLDFVLHLSTAT